MGGVCVRLRARVISVRVSVAVGVSERTRHARLWVGEGAGSFGGGIGNSPSARCGWRDQDALFSTAFSMAF